jgi:predicted nucleic acid-binding protein
VILVDTSVWVDHLRSSDAGLAKLLQNGQVLVHPFVIGELALGHLKKRAMILTDLRRLPQAVLAHDAEVLHFIDNHTLYGLGIGYVDAHLLASVRLTADGTLWTRDKRLHGIAKQLGLAIRDSGSREIWPTQPA